MILASATIIWSMWVAYIKPHFNPIPTTTNKADEIVENHNSPKAVFGCSAVKIYMRDNRKEQE